MNISKIEYTNKTKAEHFMNQLIKQTFIPIS